MKAPKIIAFYLPQYHPTVDNNTWWGKGFTEWTNVGKAKSYFWGHEQPKVPSELGYYDLRLPEVREEQARLAKEAGIEGFCYYHYWFGDGKRELELPFNEVLKLGKPDFPFCLCWANESWHSKFWNKDGTYTSKMLIEQKYLGKEDFQKHFYDILPALKDERYIKVDEKPLFMIYKPLDVPNVKTMIALWQELAKKEGLKGIYFCAHTAYEENIKELLDIGYDSVNIVRLWDCMWYRPTYKKIIGKFIRKFIWSHPFIISYKKAIKTFLGEIEKKHEKVYPTIIPNWDHSPRSGRRGYVIIKSTPSLFKKHASEVIEAVKTKKDSIIFLKSWNEWGEGNYIEPDIKHGKGYINVLHELLTK